MADDLDAFLRQAAQRRAARKKTASPRPAQRKPQPSRSPQLPSQRAAGRTGSARPVEAQVVEAAVVSEPVSRLVSHVDTSEFEDRAEQLGEEVELADEHVEERLHDTFDHQIGSLEVGGGLGAPEALDAVEASLGQQISAMLTDPESLRKAIVLADILAPPEQRW